MNLVIALVLMTLVSPVLGYLFRGLDGAVRMKPEGLLFEGFWSGAVKRTRACGAANLVTLLVSLSSLVLYAWSLVFGDGTGWLEQVAVGLLPAVTFLGIWTGACFEVGAKSMCFTVLTTLSLVGLLSWAFGPVLAVIMVVVGFYGLKDARMIWL